ncbi:Transmembrane component CbrV of energizing module of predicted cobalamin ECF transporter [Lachnospiraceae bacterium TWA4]|nr:Transmembrane component CbrV of energizing module of predicted cobalamin ECF transporter [Lachnospiraceae bacterium TWA4]
MKTKKQDAFSDCHPAVNFFYFAVVLLITMFLSHPVLLGISFFGALCYAIRLQGAVRVLKWNIIFTLPMMIIVAFINPTFNHYGVTTLFYLKTGPVTLEAMVYGVVLASMLFITLLWFSCYNIVMTTDKFVYLFGRVIPSLSLVLSMVFRFVPRFNAQLKVIRNGQKAVGRDMSNGNLLQKIKYAVTMLSILVTWALENAIDTSDSMRARGYGLKGRTAFSIFRFDVRDKWITGIFAVLLGIAGVGMKQGVFKSLYNPVIKIGGLPPTPIGIITYIAWGIFCLFPVFLGIWQDLRFYRLEKKANMERNLPWYFANDNEGRGMEH